MCRLLSVSLVYRSYISNDTFLVTLAAREIRAYYTQFLMNDKTDPSNCFPNYRRIVVGSLSARIDAVTKVMMLGR